MGGKDKSDAGFFIQARHDIHHLFAVLGVEVGGRLVSEDQFGIRRSEERRVGKECRL